MPTFTFSPVHRLTALLSPRCQSALSSLGVQTCAHHHSSTSSSVAHRPASYSSRFFPPKSFSTTSAQQTKTIKPHRLPSDLIPPYPYGERRVYKQSNRGLYGSARIRFGNNVAEKHNNKSRRFWRPNVHVKAFFSPSLGARVKTRLTLRVLKTIRREGGIENYLLKSKPARIKELGPGGWNLRWILMQTQAVQQRFNEQRIELGLELKDVENRDDIIQLALDCATPGPLSLRSRATLDDLRATAADAFVLGEDNLGDIEGVEELSDEAERKLLYEFESVDAALPSTWGQTAKA
ncbi:39S ribosomal protein L24, mitochondrial [Metarhizium rileyi]|nr:39S ribosomal protein L24, mitochondrial [Metarhizium rileyi]